MSRNGNGYTSIEKLLSGSVAVLETETLPAAPDTAGDPDNQAASWQCQKAPNQKTTVVKCIVIDRMDQWHINTPVDLKGVDASAFTWGHYGRNYPVLIEQENGDLEPFQYQQIPGESSNRLYKGANPSGFRATFKHKNDLLRKIEIGLMVGLVLGLFFIMFIFLNWEGGS